MPIIKISLFYEIGIHVVEDKVIPLDFKSLGNLKVREEARQVTS